MSVIDKAVAHFEKQDRRDKYVEEWDVKVYAIPLTVGEKSRWSAKSEGDNAAYMAYALIGGLQNEDGTPVFDLADKKALMTKVDADVVTELFNFVMNFDKDTPEEREKN